MGPTSQYRRLWLAIALAAVCGAAVVPARGQSLMYGRTEVKGPERSDAGNWQGTWFYVSRLHRMAFWMQDGHGRPSLMFRMHGAQASGESFTTDWTGKAEYDFPGGHGSFRMEFDQADRDTIAGRWVWEKGTPESGRRETTEFTMYRAGNGRQLAFNISDTKSEVWGAATPKPAVGELVWLFHKASRRQASWGELPF